MIYCWTRCFNLAGRLVVKSESVLSREQVLRWGLDLNSGDRERRGDIFGEVLALMARRSLWCFCVIGEILWKSCVVDGNTLGGAGKSFGVDTLGSFKMGDCCNLLQKRHWRRWNQVEQVICVWWYQMVAILMYE